MCGDKSVSNIKKRDGVIIKLSDLYTVDEFISFYENATKREIQNRIKNLKKKPKTNRIKNEIKALEALKL